MKKLISLCLMLLVCLSLSACSKSDTGIPDDLVVVLPDGQELYLYMPHDDAAEILGAAYELYQINHFEGNFYIYDDLELWVAYTNGLLSFVDIQESSPCTLKNGVGTQSKKSDFVKAKFSDGCKYYSVENDKYTLLNEAPDECKTFQSIALANGPSDSDFNLADKPTFKGYSLRVYDSYAFIVRKYDN